MKQAPCEHLIGMNRNSCQKVTFSVEDPLMCLLNNPAPKCTLQNKGKMLNFMLSECFASKTVVWNFVKRPLQNLKGEGLL